jgi:hypothetical protein
MVNFPPEKKKTPARPKLKKGNLNYDKIFEFTRLWVILIMGRKNFSFFRKSFTGP